MLFVTPIKFKASFPAIQSAIKIGADGMRLQLDVPETEMANAIELLTCRNVVLNVTIEAEEELPQEELNETDFSFDLGEFNFTGIS